MVHDDDTSEPVPNVIRSRDMAPAVRPATLTDAKYDLIREIAIEQTTWGPQQIHEWFLEEMNRPDISIEMVYYVLKWERPARRPAAPLPPVARRPTTWDS